MALKDQVEKINKDIEKIIEIRETIEELQDYDEVEDYEDDYDIDYDIAEENLRREEETENFMRGVL